MRALTMACRRIHSRRWQSFDRATASLHDAQAITRVEDRLSSKFTRSFFFEISTCVR
jgi:hypothetical protein